MAKQASLGKRKAPAKPKVTEEQDDQKPLITVDSGKIMINLGPDYEQDGASEKKRDKKAAEKGIT